MVIFNFYAHVLPNKTKVELRAPIYIGGTMLRFILTAFIIKIFSTLGLLFFLSIYAKPFSGRKHHHLL